MEKNQDCMYCMEDERRDHLMIEIGNLDVSTVFLFKEQTYRGRCNVVYKGHVKELFHLNEQESASFIHDVNRVAEALDKIFEPNKINYGAYGDTLHHLHMHIVPKYEGKENWGSTFEMNLGKTYLTDNEYNEMIEKIKTQLQID
ncbi:diadenosine tetraphosphate (Ap4A) HIT family hydrolase [Neobacillus bataviensis]|uniref:Diadenosine tetraphosphate (Ap4A) HIT family hydrolase n=1 Tax=Neobacillus bataviensis TaxID=220685 RepID=A0A561DXT4_9BACI|nr:HIT family protein [Neobacillus bataviensis]TWE08181.1 diadenosine tetraphosphate (Ap4A) HIT family hydrolase [Neobacillus bataviensis]